MRVGFWELHCVESSKIQKIGPGVKLHWKQRGGLNVASVTRMETRRWKQAQDKGPDDRDRNPEKALGRVGRRWSGIGSQMCSKLSLKFLIQGLSISPWEGECVKNTRVIREHQTFPFIEVEAESQRGQKIHVSDTGNKSTETTAQVACCLLGYFDKNSY